MTLANKITCIRLLNVPVYIVLLLCFKQSIDAGTPNQWYRWASFLIFVTTVMLDGLDGFVARKRKEITRIGTILDPLADKMLIFSSLLLLSSLFKGSSDFFLPLWFIGLVVGRDLLLLFGFLIISSVTGSVTVHARLSGKCASVLQAVVIALVLMHYHGVLSTVAIATAAFFTAVSSVQYTFDGRMQLQVYKLQKATN
ncbi:MAG: CDP-alcohol phosphatidyltransferase family protein [Chitinivibrionales bacterium]|nr:CDP-alcohol phosphatidyltransferase family protein [Chitinivibrionales bacterium]